MRFKKLFLLPLILIIIGFCGCTQKSEGVTLRRFPYPYLSMLAVQSHTDGTGLSMFGEIHRFLNTEDSTPYGKGLGLDIADSFWMYTANDGSNIPAKYKGKDYSAEMMSWFYGTDTSRLKDRDFLKRSLEFGWIDSIHSFGDFSRVDEDAPVFERSLAESALSELKKNNSMPSIWINHGNRANIENFGAGQKPNFKYQQGDNIKSPAYHTDLTIAAGIKYVWASEYNGKFGHKFPLYPIELRDGGKVWGFYAYTGEDRFLKKHTPLWSPDNIYKQLSKENLEKLIKNRDFVLVASHFGAGSLAEFFSYGNISAFTTLRNYQWQRKILVARSKFLLDYAVSQKYLAYAVSQNDDGTSTINIERIDDPVLGSHPPKLDEVRGITFYVDNPDKFGITLSGESVDQKLILRNPPDDTGKPSIMISWHYVGKYDLTKGYPS